MYASSTIGSVAYQITIGALSTGALSLLAYAWRHRVPIIERWHSTRARSLVLVAVGSTLMAMVLLGAALGSLEGSIADDGAGADSSAAPSTSTATTFGTSPPATTSTTTSDSTSTEPASTTSPQSTTTLVPRTPRTSTTSTATTTAKPKPTTTVAVTVAPSSNLIEITAVSYSTALGTCDADGRRVFTVVATFRLADPHAAGNLNVTARAVTSISPPPLPWAAALPVAVTDPQITGMKVQFNLKAGDEVLLTYASTPTDGTRSATATATVRPDSFPAC